MACIVFHGPNDSNECRNFVRKLAKEWGGKFSYNSFFDARRGWYSGDTVGKAAYCVRLPITTRRAEDRTVLAGFLCEARKVKGPQDLKLRTFY